MRSEQSIKDPAIFKEITLEFRRITIIIHLQICLILPHYQIVIIDMDVRLALNLCLNTRA